MVKNKAIIIVDYAESIKLPFAKAVKICMDETKKTGYECLFTYERKNKKLTSAIIRGVEKNIILMPFDVFGEKQGVEEPEAVFHSHPKIPGSCSFSVVDINTDLVKRQRAEISLGCTNKNVVLKFNANAIEKYIDFVMEKHAMATTQNDRVKKEFLRYLAAMEKKHPEMKNQIEEMRNDFLMENQKEFRKKFEKLYDTNPSFRKEFTSMINKNATRTKIVK